MDGREKLAITAGKIIMEAQERGESEELVKELFSSFFDNTAGEHTKFKTYIATSDWSTFKIGRTTSLHGRLSALRVANPDIEYVSVFDIDIESCLHKQFANKRYKGEWFRLTNDDLRAIKRQHKMEAVDECKLRAINSY